MTQLANRAWLMEDLEHKIAIPESDPGLLENLARLLLRERGNHPPRATAFGHCPWPPVFVLLGGEIGAVETLSRWVTSKAYPWGLKTIPTGFYTTDRGQLMTLAQLTVLSYP